jgi:ABC-2 type transport system ATP-binding protein
VGELATAVHQLRGLDTDELRRRAEDLGLAWQAIREVSFRDLSGGMKQKLLIALAMASRPELLILDEPTASLDAGTRELFFQLFTALDPATTVILCSHRLDEMRHLIDQVVALADGSIRYDGSAAEFLGSRAVSVIEILVASGNGRGRWLEELGFQARLGGWWQRTVRQKEKAELLPLLARHLGESLTDLHVRDLESIALDDAGEGKE